MLHERFLASQETTKFSTSANIQGRENLLPYLHFEDGREGQGRSQQDEDPKCEESPNLSLDEGVYEDDSFMKFFL